MDSKAAPEEQDPDKADDVAYLRCVKQIFGMLDISWDVLEPRLVAVVSDGPYAMRSFVDLLNDKP